MAKRAKKSAKKAAKKAAASSARTKIEDSAKIKVLGEHKRREGSRYYGGFEAMKKASTVGAFRKARAKEGDATELLRAATNDGYIRISA